MDVVPDVILESGWRQPLHEQCTCPLNLGMTGEPWHMVPPQHLGSQVQGDKKAISRTQTLFRLWGWGGADILLYVQSQGGNHTGWRKDDFWASHLVPIRRKLPGQGVRFAILGSTAIGKRENSYDQSRLRTGAWHPPASDTIPPTLASPQAAHGSRRRSSSQLVRVVERRRPQVTTQRASSRWWGQFEALLWSFNSGWSGGKN